jgi:malate dehydrogenase (oxaloacetate-decarboxylating)
LLTHC